MQLFNRINTYPIPLAIRWSASIAALLALVMSLLGWFLISQQQLSYHQQTNLLGELIVDQFTRAASEPLVADDILSLEILVSQQEKHKLILGMQLFDLSGKVLATAGENPFVRSAGETALIPQLDGEPNTVHTKVSEDGMVISYTKPVRFQNTHVGYAAINIDRRPMETNLRRTVNALVLTTVGLITVGVFLAFPLAYRFCRPIHELMEAGEAIDRGETWDLEDQERRDEIGRVLTSFRNMSAGLESKRQIEKTLSKYLSPTVANKVLAQDGEQQLGGTRSEGSVLFCDIVGFTKLSEELEPEEVSELLNSFFRYFAVAGQSCHGTVDNFIGDCIMILFGIPEQDELHAFHALTCAILIQSVAARINKKRISVGAIPVGFRIGINSGVMLAGNLGSHERMQFTVVGDTVNVASRICGLAEPGGILLTDDAAAQPGMRGYIRPSGRGPIYVRGRTTPIIPYVSDHSMFEDEYLLQQSLDAIYPDPGGSS